MHAPFRLVLMILSFLCFGLALWQPTAPLWNRLVAAGLCAASAALIFG
jgi:hypothetical protein